MTTLEVAFDEVPDSDKLTYKDIPKDEELHPLFVVSCTTSLIDGCRGAHPYVRVRTANAIKDSLYVAYRSLVSEKTPVYYRVSTCELYLPFPVDLSGCVDTSDTLAVIRYKKEEWIDHTRRGERDGDPIIQ